jgi:transcription elongation factor
MDFEEEENSMFKIGDLVNIKNSHIICYIIESSKFNLKVVTTRNEVKKISVREVDIINLKKKTTYLMDSKGYPLTPDNTVKVINGPNKGSKGTIKCIYNKYIFLHNNNYTRTNGIFCEINENVELLGSELLIEGSEKGKVNHRKIPNDIRELIGKTVHVIEGKWKGYNGILINADDKSIKLELSAKQKTISLPFSSIEKGDVNSAKDGDEPSIAPSLSMKTPAYFLNGHHS